MSTVPPSKTDLLSWLNSLIKDRMKPLDRVQELGHGTGFLYLLNELYPGVVKTAKINTKARLDHENTSNLKLLANTLPTLGIHQTIEITKLARMKYQDNLALLQFFYKHAMDNQLPKDKKIKEVPKMAPPKLVIIPPKTVNPIQIKKTRIETSDDLRDIQRIGRLCAPQHQQLQLVRGVFDEQASNEIKLKKIQKILFGQTFESVQKTSRQQREQREREQNEHKDKVYGSYSVLNQSPGNESYMKYIVKNVGRMTFNPTVSRKGQSEVEIKSNRSIPQINERSQEEEEKMLQQNNADQRQEEGQQIEKAKEDQDEKLTQQGEYLTNNQVMEAKSAEKNGDRASLNDLLLSSSKPEKQQ